MSTRPVTWRYFRNVEIALWCALLIGPALIWTGMRNNFPGRRSLQWPKVQGTVVRCERSPDYHIYHLDFSYRYRVDGIAYMGTQLGFWEPYFRGHRYDYQTFAAQHPVNSLLDVYYDPQHPGNSVIIPGADEFRNGALIGLGAVLFALAGLLVVKSRPFFAYIIPKKKAEPAPAPRKVLTAYPHGFLSYEPGCRFKLACYRSKQELHDFLGTNDDEKLQDWKPEDRVFDSIGREYRIMPRPNKKSYDIEPTGETWSYEKLLTLAEADARLHKKDPVALRQRVESAPDDKKIPMLMKGVEELQPRDAWALTFLGVFCLVSFFAIYFGITWFLPLVFRVLLHKR